MGKKCKHYIEKYLQILKCGFDIVSETEDECHFVTPFFKPDGEAVEIFLKKSDKGFILTDGYMTSDYLFSNGLELENNKNFYEKAEMIAKSHGVSFKKSEIFTEVGHEDVHKGMEKILNAVEAITYLVYKRSHRKTKTFSDEVELFFAENNIDAEISHLLTGRITEHTVPFFINFDKNIAVSPFSIESVSAAVKEVKVLGFIAKDVKEIRTDICFSVVLDDKRPEFRAPWNNEAVRAILKECIDYVVEWRNRNDLLKIIK